MCYRICYFHVGPLPPPLNDLGRGIVFLCDLRIVFPTHIAFYKKPFFFRWKIKCLDIRNCPFGRHTLQQCADGPVLAVQKPSPPFFPAFCRPGFSRAFGSRPAYLHLSSQNYSPCAAVSVPVVCTCVWLSKSWY